MQINKKCNFGMERCKGDGNNSIVRKGQGGEIYGGASKASLGGDV